MANKYSPISISEQSSFTPVPIAPQRKSILPVKIPVPAPRSSIESKKQRESIDTGSDAERIFGSNNEQKNFEEKNHPDQYKSRVLKPWENPSHCVMVIFLVLIGILITIFVPGKTVRVIR